MDEMYRGHDKISIHAPVKGATSSFFKPNIPKTISIHAPVKGATSSFFKPNIPKTISIHAPVKGATLLG